VEPKVTAIIQARMTSTRLPGKVMKEVLGRPLLSYQIERLRFSKRIDDIIIATTTNKEDDPIVKFASKEGLKSYRGSEDDVLDRYYQTAKKYGVENILRLTGDCPLLDPIICDHSIDTYISGGGKFVHTGPTFAEGVDCEIFHYKYLKDAWKNAKKKSEREHCTLYFHNHPEKFDKVTLVKDTDDSRYRYAVDNPEDFLVVKAIVEHFYKDGNPNFSTDDIKRFLDANNDIFRLNVNIIRNEGLKKSLREDEKYV